MSDSVYQRNVSVTANTDILGTDWSPATTGGWAVITIVTTAAGKLSIVYKDGTNSDVGITNNNADLAAGAAYTFQTPVPIGESINIRYSVNDTFKRLVIVEG